MRQVLSLSFPKNTTQEVKKMAKKRGFNSLSAYIKYLVELDKDLISELELLNSIKQARKEYGEGKSVKAKSIAGLL
jgi:Arc/MetJ-type ribon-helix-helix transcriptional regulator